MIENVAVVIGLIAVVLVAGFAVYKFFKLEKAKQIEIISEWLLIAVIQAEKALGSGTGQIKLRFVYNLFLDRFGIVSKLITFDMFSALVDEALVKMRSMIESNKKVEEYIMRD